MIDLQRKGGKKNRKWGRNARKPSTARRNLLRPDLRRKARNVARRGGDVKAWAEFRIAQKGDSAELVYRIRDKAITEQEERTAA
jgi:hypothetical protein